MTKLFALIVCIYFDAPFYIFVIGFLCLMMDD